MLKWPPEFTISLPTGGIADLYAQNLLEDLGIPVATTTASGEDHPARSWADCGLMHLMESTHDSLRLCPVPLPGCADGALSAFRALVGTNILPLLKGSQFMTERSAICAQEGSDSRIPGDHCRLLKTLDGMLAVNLARDDDWDLIPAWLGENGPKEWQFVTQQVATNNSLTLLDQGRLLGLAVADATEIPVQAHPWFKANRFAGARVRQTNRPRVLDLSSLWAGPLCSHLWQAAGAEVIKVESSRRPDGARSGPKEFFDLLNQGKHCINLDLHESSGQRELLRLIQKSDIVLEASRPRALRQMKIFAEDVISSNPGITWVSITAYGRDEPQANWIGYGDDTGVAAGLSAIMHEVSGQWSICGDAIADPLTGLHAALAGWADWASGGGQVLELSLEQTVRHCITSTAPPGNNYHERYSQWLEYLETHQLVARFPQLCPARHTSAR